MEIAPDAVRALATLGYEETPDVLLQVYPRLRSYTAKMEAVNALASRAAFARELLDAVERKAIPAQYVGALQIRQLRSLGDLELNKRIATLWPDHREVTSEKQGQILRLKEQLTPERITAGNAVQGRVLFGQLCGTCHTLFGEGAVIGPDLTGSDRKNVDFLLNNIVDPSGVVAQNYRVSTIRMKDERVINGVVGTKTDRTLTVQTPTEKMVLERKEIESVTESEFSLMPEGLIDSLKPEEVRDLMAYLTATAPPREQPTGPIR
jgi:putative heme-binding domain-containing protein